MRQYPRSLKLENKPESSIIVRNEAEEIAASLKGYESHWNPEVNEKRKGTEKEILRGEEKVLSPQQRAAITRKKNKAAKEA